MTGIPTSTRQMLRRPNVGRLLLMALFAEIGYAVLNVSAMPVYLKYNRGLGEAVIGLVVASYLLSEAVFKSPMGRLADRLGTTRLMALGPLLTVGTSLLTLAVPHDAGWLEIGCLVFLRAADGLGAAMIWPAAFAAMSDSVEPNERQQGMSLLNMCYLLGVGLALPIGGMANDVTRAVLRDTLAGYTASFYLAAGLFGLVSMAAMRLRPPAPRQRLAHEEADPALLIEGAHRIPAYLAIAAVAFMGVGFPMLVVKLFAIEQFDLTETGFGLLFLPAALLMAGLSVPMARLGDRIGPVLAVRLGLAFCLVGMVVVSLGAFVALFRSGWAIAVGGALVGLGFLLAIPAWMAIVTDLHPEKRAANLGAVMAAQGVGAIIGAPLGAFLYEQLQAFDRTVGRYSPFLGCAACLAVAWAMSWRVIRPSRVGVRSSSSGEEPPRSPGAEPNPGL
ncbi:MAG: MFS transporter [Fimbriimonadaceae bacterium]|nr:MFS transporter [Fimbriimonadaceae bacterium]